MLGKGKQKKREELEQQKVAARLAFEQASVECSSNVVASSHGGAPKDLSAVRAAIAEVMNDRTHDDGSLGPLFIRFAWHQSGTYDKEKGTGGSNGCTMRFPAEANDPENAGFSKAIAALAKVRDRHSDISLADIYTLAGYVAIEETGGPPIPFAYGRVDFTKEEAVAVHGPSGCPFGDGQHNPGASRLPAADLGPAAAAPRGCPMHVKEKPTIDAIRGVFQRLGFNDKETVCLIILGHQYGRCHLDVSGNDHPWYVFDPASWSIHPGGLGFLTAFTEMSRNYREVRPRPIDRTSFFSAVSCTRWHAALLYKLTQGSCRSANAEGIGCA